MELWKKRKEGETFHLKTHAATLAGMGKKTKIQKYKRKKKKKKKKRKKEKKDKKTKRQKDKKDKKEGPHTLEQGGQWPPKF